MQAAFASHNFHTVYYKIQHIKVFFSLSEHTHMHKFIYAHVQIQPV